LRRAAKGGQALIWLLEIGGGGGAFRKAKKRKKKAFFGGARLGSIFQRLAHSGKQRQGARRSCLFSL